MDESLGAQKKEWENQEKPTGDQANDNNWTVFGQGRTGGFYAGSLSIGQEAMHNLEHLDTASRVGLFEKPGLYPAVIRFSDSGADTANCLSVLLRMAVKLSVPWAPHGEINLTTTESLEFCPFADFNDVRAVNKTTDKVSEVVYGLGEAFMALQSSLIRDIEFKSGEFLSKTYYSQLPYLLGETQAFKFKFTALQDPNENVGKEYSDMAKALRDYVGRNEAKFQLDIQVHPDASSKQVFLETKEAWDDSIWVPVGVLTIAKQTTAQDGMGEALKAALVKGEQLEDEKQIAWLHKSFPFHPALTIKEHFPTGFIHQFRCQMYARSMAQRMKMVDGVVPRMLNFEHLTADVEVRAMFARSKLETFDTRDEPAILQNMGSYARFLSKQVPPVVIKAIKTPMTDEDLVSGDIKPASLEFKVHQVGALKLKLFTEDALLGRVECKALLLLRVLRSGLVFPLEDKFATATKQEWHRIRKYLGFAQSLPEPNHGWKEVSSDASTSRFFFYGAGQVLTVPSGDKGKPFVVDFSHLKDAKVRPGMEHYGLQMFFDAKQKPVLVKDVRGDKTFAPGDREWEAAKFRVRQTAAMCITAVDHLLAVHLLAANEFVNAVRFNLPMDHVLHRLAIPFTFRTVYVNNRAADSLLPERSMLHRASALEYEGVVELLEDGAAKSHVWEPFPAMASAKYGELCKTSPFVVDGIGYYETVRAFVADWVAQAYKTDADVQADKACVAFYKALVDSSRATAYVLPAMATLDAVIEACSTVIWTVTGLHENVGSVSEYLDLSDGMGFRACSGQTKTDLQSGVILGCLMSTTSLRTPALMSKFDQYFVGGEVEIWAKFQDQLAKYSDTVQARNKTRKHAYNNFDPKILEVAVSV